MMMMLVVLVVVGDAYLALVGEKRGKNPQELTQAFSHQPQLMVMVSTWSLDLGRIFAVAFIGQGDTLHGTGLAAVTVRAGSLYRYSLRMWARIEE